jgi:hypothetical protein
MKILQRKISEEQLSMYFQKILTSGKSFAVTFSTTFELAIKPLAFPANASET